MDEDTLHRRVFAQHAHGGGKAKVGDVAKMLACCGHALTREEVDAVTAELRSNKDSSGVSLENFLAVVRSNAMAPPGRQKQEAVRALHDFNILRGIDSDFITEADLKCAMAQVGRDPASKTEIAGMLEDLDKRRVARNSRGDINIDSFVEKVLLIAK